MEQQSWRTGFTQDSRNKIVSKINGALQRHTPMTEQYGVEELWKIARRFEEKIFYAASDQHDYLRKISLKLLNLETFPNSETRTQNKTSSTLAAGSNETTQGPVRSLVDTGGIAQGQSWQQVGQPTPAGVLNNLIQGSAGGPASSFSIRKNVPQPSLTNAVSIAQVQARQQGVPPTPAGMLTGGAGDSLQQVSQAGGIDEADHVWTKMQMLTEKYLQDMKDLNSKLITRSQQHMPQEELPEEQPEQAAQILQQQQQTHEVNPAPTEFQFFK